MFDRLLVRKRKSIRMLLVELIGVIQARRSGRVKLRVLCSPDLCV
jgi:hypothetical protein